VNPVIDLFGCDTWTYSLLHHIQNLAGQLATTPNAFNLLFGLDDHSSGSSSSKRAHLVSQHVALLIFFATATPA
jgi:hypothetical protein